MFEVRSFTSRTGWQGTVGLSCHMVPNSSINACGKPIGSEGKVTKMTSYWYCLALFPDRVGSTLYMSASSSPWSEYQWVSYCNQHLQPLCLTSTRAVPSSPDRPTDRLAGWYRPTSQGKSSQKEGLVPPSRRGSWKKGSWKSKR